MVSITWITRKYLEFIRDSPNIQLTALMDRIRREHKVVVTINKCFCAKRKALEIIKGEDSE